MWLFHQCKLGEKLSLFASFHVTVSLTLTFFLSLARLTVDSENVIDQFTPSFDVDLGSFLSKAGSFAPEFTLDTLFANLTNLLEEVAGYAPDLNAGDSSTALGGLFDIVNDVSQFGGALEDFLLLIENGEFYPERYQVPEVDSRWLSFDR